MAIAVSFFVMIVAVAVSAGFRHSIRQGVAAMTGDIRITPYISGKADPDPMPRVLPEDEALRAIEGVKSITPVAVRAGIVKNGDLVHGVVVKGIPERADTALSRPLTVSIPHRLQEITGLGPGDDITIYFVGEKVRVRKFHIGALHRDLLEFDDNLLVYASLEDIQRLNGWDAQQVSCLEVLLADASPGKQEQAALRIGTLLEDYIVSLAVKSYPQVFDWLDLLDYNVLIILLLMTVVAGFNMVSGLLVMLLRNISTVGTLKTLGMESRAVGRLFARIGARASLKGMLWGNAAALLFCLVQGTTHLIPLDPANYFVSYVPVHVNLPAILAADAAAFAGILALLWLPTLVIARIDPARTVKAD